LVCCLVTACIVCPLLMANGQAHFLPFMEHALLRPWLHAALVGFAVCMVVLVTISLLTAPVSVERLRTTTVSDWPSLWVAKRTHYQVALGVLLAVCASLWFVMR
jgi:hypothetical protein